MVHVLHTERMRNADSFDQKPLEECGHRGQNIKMILTFWRRIFFQILAHSVFKM